MTPIHVSEWLLYSSRGSTQDCGVNGGVSLDDRNYSTRLGEDDPRLQNKNSYNIVMIAMLLLNFEYPPILLPE